MNGVTLEQWTEQVQSVVIQGNSVEELMLLINWCSENEVDYDLSVPNQKASGSSLRFTLNVQCNNMKIYELRKMWNNYLVKK